MSAHAVENGGVGGRFRELALAAGLVLAWTFAGPVPGGAHENHRTPPPAPVVRADADSDTLPRREPLPVTVAIGDTLSGSRFEMPPLHEALGHHLHNKLIHFPIVFTPLAFLALALSRGRAALGGLARGLAWLAALSAGGALWAGLAQAPVFEGEPKQWLVLVHRNWGIATTVMLALTALAAQWARTRPYAWAPAFLAMVFTSIVAYLGGLVSHG